MRIENAKSIDNSFDDKEFFILTISLFLSYLDEFARSFSIAWSILF